MDNFAPVTVVVRSMDRPTLRRALDSISAQTIKPREVIVVGACGAGHGPLPSMSAEIRSRLVLPPPGVERLTRPHAANAGLLAAEEEWIGFLDDDDELLPDHFATLWPVARDAYAAHGPRARLVYALAQGVEASGAPADVYGRSFSIVQIWNNTIMHTMSALFHRSLVAEGCVMDSRLEILEDWDFWIQCSRKTPFIFVERATSLWHGAEGDSGCGFGTNTNGERYRAAQLSIQEKWANARDTALARLKALTDDALAAYSRGDEQIAMNKAQMVLHLDPENADAANLLGAISLRHGDLDSAEQLLDAAIRNAPPHFGVFFNRGVLEIAKGNKVGAREWLQKANALNPAHEGIRKRLREVEAP